MNKIEFITTVKNGLAGYPEAEIMKSIACYIESIDDRIEDGMSEADAIAGLGNISEILESIKLDMPMPVIARARVINIRGIKKDSKLKKILIITTSPIWIMFLLGAIMVCFGYYMAAFGVIAAFFMFDFSLYLCAATVGVAGIYQMITGSFTGGIMVFGGALLFAGLALLLTNPCKAFAKCITNQIKKFGRLLKHLVIGKGGAQND